MLIKITSRMLHEILLILNGLESDPVGYLSTCETNLHAGEKDLVQKCLELGSIYKQLSDYVALQYKSTMAAPVQDVGLYEISVRSLLKRRLNAYMDCLIQIEIDFVENRMGSVRFWLETLEPVSERLKNQIYVYCL